MLTCKECGFTTNRLQWTHFKYNCSGRFKNGKEYKNAYPGELLVDPVLSKKTAITLANLIEKYGTESGQTRWESYRRKQAETNTFEYKKEKFGWSEDEFAEYNKGRSATLENMISRHGEDIGIERWNAYCERQRYTNTVDYFKKKLGHDAGLEKYKEINAKKALVHRVSSQIYSKVEKEFILLLESQLGNVDNSSIANPYCLWDNDLNRHYIYDIKHKDCIIEFNGDYWHANPLIYNEADTIKDHTATEIWNKDARKIEVANKKGFRTLVVWESDYINNKEKTITEVIKWILNEQQ